MPASKMPNTPLEAVEGRTLDRLAFDFRTLVTRFNEARVMVIGETIRRLGKELLELGHELEGTELKKLGDEIFWREARKRAGM